MERFHSMSKSIWIIMLLLIIQRSWNCVRTLASSPHSYLPRVSEVCRWFPPWVMMNFLSPSQPPREPFCTCVRSAYARLCFSVHLDAFLYSCVCVCVHMHVCFCLLRSQRRLISPAGPVRLFLGAHSSQLEATAVTCSPSIPLSSPYPLSCFFLSIIHLPPCQ